MDRREEHREPAAEAAKEELPPPTHVGALLHVLLMGAAIAFTISSTVVYWVRSYQPGTTIQIDLWQVWVITPSGTSVTPIDNQCNELAYRVETGESFAIISCVVAAAAFGFGLVTLRTGRLWLVSLILSAALMGTAIICWAVVLRVYLEPYCLGESFKDLGFDLGPGAYLMVLASIVALLSIIVLLVDPAWPATRAGRRQLTSFVLALAGLVSTLFCALGCGLPVWKYRVSNTVAFEVAIWKTNNNGTVVDNSSLGCYDLVDMWRAAAAFSIASAVLSAGVLLVGVARFFKVVPVVPAFVIGGVTSLTTLITWAVLTNIWYRQFCPGTPSYEQQYFIRLPAYGFFVASFTVVLLATLFVVWASVANHGPETAFRPMDVGLLLSVFCAALFGVICMPFQFFEDFLPSPAYARVFLWYVDVVDANGNFTHFSNLYVYFGCYDLDKMIKAVRYVQLVGVLFAGAALLFAFMIFRAPRLRVVVLIANYFACGLYGLALLLWIIAYNNVFCSGTSITDQGFSVSTGGALQIIGFLCTLYGAFVPCAEAMLGSREPAP